MSDAFSELGRHCSAQSVVRQSESAIRGIRSPSRERTIT